MNKKRYLILTTLLFLSCIPKTYAACTQEEINEFKKVENKYKVTYEFNKDTKDYTITFYTPNREKYDFIIYTDMKLNCKEINETEIECYNMPADEYELGIVGNTTTCSDELKQITLKLSKFNNYSEDPLCDGIEEFYLCQPTYDKEIDYDTFVSRVNTYKKSKEKEETKDQNEEEKENKILQYIEDNLIQIIIITIFIILVIITTIVTIKSARKSRRLE